jgi:hypothetical protein
VVFRGIVTEKGKYAKRDIARKRKILRHISSLPKCPIESVQEHVESDAWQHYKKEKRMF